jgi:peptide/nickel transport system substrate-binding protein
LRRFRAWALPALLLAACQAGGRARERVVIQLSADIRGLDPNESVEQATDAVLINVFEPLVGLDENLRAEPLLAESWEQASGERWRFRLRKGVVFHDGTPLTAVLVRDALLAVKGNPQLEASQFLSSVREIVVYDDSTLDIVTVEPRAILSSLPFVYVAKPNAPGAFPPLLGTGPYRIDSWQPGVRVVLARWERYRGALPAVREAVFHPPPEGGDSLAALEDGTADIPYDIAAERAARPAPGVRIVRRPGLTVFYLAFDLAPRPDNPFRDLRVRQALHLALDRQDLVQRVQVGMAAVASQPVAPPVFGFNTRISEPRTDLATATQLLAEAGYRDGFRTRLVISSARLDLAQLVAKQWRRVGVELEIEGVPAADVDRVAARGVPIYLLGWDCSTGEASEAYEFLLHTPDERYGRGNYGGYSNRALDSIAEVNSAILDPQKRRRMLEEAASLVMHDLPILPLFVTEEIYGVRDGIRFRPRVDNLVRLAGVSFE